jgi:hypothetical protein
MKVDGTPALRRRRPVAQTQSSPKAPQFAFDPAHGIGFDRIVRHHPGFGVSAFCAFERTLLKTFRPVRDGSRDHPRLAIRATRT